MATLVKGFEWCPHCRGNTTCTCGTCGREIMDYDSAHNERFKRWVAGACTVCKGLGQIPEREK